MRKYIDEGLPDGLRLNQVATISLPTHWADFRLLAFEYTPVGYHAGELPVETALALVLGDLHSSPPIVRIHSQCTTGDVFHSLRCDCHDQLQLALRVIADEGSGMVIYEHQEGRGIGLMEKLRAYELQERGYDTIDANIQLGHAVDLRNYQLAVSILHFLEIRSVRLMTNNPCKIEAVLISGIEVIDRLSADVPIGPHAAKYVATKREKMGHMSGVLG
jgi:GTP cyclohydrolase II